MFSSDGGLGSEARATSVLLRLRGLMRSGLVSLRPVLIQQTNYTSLHTTSSLHSIIYRDCIA